MILLRSAYCALCLIQSYSFIAIPSTMDLGSNQAKKALSLFKPPAITSGLRRKRLSTAIRATVCGDMLNRSAAFCPLVPTFARFTKLVSVGPGQIQVTETDVFLSSRYSPRLKFST